jgi:hypothetical protein
MRDRGVILPPDHGAVHPTGLRTNRQPRFRRVNAHAWRDG